MEFFGVGVRSYRVILGVIWKRGHLEMHRPFQRSFRTQLSTIVRFSAEKVNQGQRCKDEEDNE
ncbi:MAG: hypothetical protein RL215_2688 [Planctomycetota bacterium]